MTAALHRPSLPRLAGDTLVIALLPVACGFAVVSPQGLTWLPLLIALAMGMAWRRNLAAAHAWRELAKASPFLLAVTLFAAWTVFRSVTAANPAVAFAASAPFLFSLALVIASFPLTTGISSAGRWHWGFFPLVNIALAVLTVLAANGLINLAPLGGARLGELWHFNRAALLSAMLLPISIFAIDAMEESRPRRLALHALTATLVGIGVFGSYSESAQLAFIAILAIHGLGLFAGNLAPRLISGSLAAGLLALPLAFVSIFDWFRVTSMWESRPLTVKPRLLMWRAMVDNVEEAPFIGKGVEFVRATGYRNPETSALTAETHPHSFLFQIWVDLGLVGVVLLIAVVALLAEILRRVEGPARVMYASIMAGTLGVWSVSHGMWQSWFVGLVGICVLYAGIVHHRRNAQR